MSTDTPVTNAPTPAEKKKEEVALNRKGRRRQAAFRPQSEAQMKREATLEAGKQMRHAAIARKQEAAHVRAVIRNAGRVPVITNAQRKLAAERERRLEAKKKRRAAYLRRQAKTV